MVVPEAQNQLIDLRIEHRQLLCQNRNQVLLSRWVGPMLRVGALSLCLLLLCCYVRNPVTLCDIAHSRFVFPNKTHMVVEIPKSHFHRIPSDYYGNPSTITVENQPQTSCTVSIAWEPSVGGLYSTAAILL